MKLCKDVFSEILNLMLKNYNSEANTFTFKSHVHYSLPNLINSENIHN